MKKIILSLISVLFIMSYVHAEGVDDFFQKYKSKDNVQYVHVTSALLKNASKLVSTLAMFNYDMNAEDQEALKMLEAVEDIKVLVSDNKDLNMTKKFYKRCINKSKEYTLFTEVSSKGEYINVYAKNKTDDIISSIVCLVEDKVGKRSVMVHIKGNLKPEDIAKAINTISKK